ncbi:MAG TPA: GGDEF domain-containing protein [Pseudolabrys sp.]|nr:GGDEF domain-containing protein [Pseudolabrys sp.]
MPVTASVPSFVLVIDIPTLSLVAVCMSALLGLVLLLNWVQQPGVKALAWWGAAYLIGAISVALWSVPGSHAGLAGELPSTMIFMSCGMVWTGLRLFHGRVSRPLLAFAGVPIWLILNQWTLWTHGSYSRSAFAAIMVASYAFAIAFELWRERRKSLYSRVAAVIVPGVHAAIFLMPLALRNLWPDLFDASWPNVFALETVLYGIGAGFIMLLLVKDRHVLAYRTAASTDHLTGLRNRRAFLEAANAMQARQGARGEPVTLLMFDLDHFKSVNDRFGHATGDSVLRVFAQVALASMRASDVVGRLGGEEFAAIVPEAMGDAVQVAERLRTAFQVTGLIVDDIAVGATVSIGLATTYRSTQTLDALILRADDALYEAKHGGRNRYCCAEDEPGQPGVPVKSARKLAARRGNPEGATAAG